MRKIEQQMLAAVESCLRDASFEGCAMRSTNTTVRQDHDGVHGTYGYRRVVDVILHKTTIVRIDAAAGTVTLRTNGWHTVTTSSRIEAVLSRFCRGWHVNLSRGQLYLRKESWGAGEREPLLDGRELEIQY